ncbi:uncharacterized protein LOC132911430 [Bombus pascuorum]|uniref:uncharacterized protein LOC132911049 n=1 Tax=Bombus pascuorum TaxID=65598 RepID=UPI00298E19E3|nr:uncharacterized protein LOC132911049 [Bombus pascuorum]XP_060824014.1 uncharacterized protein LOC132911417 [Bombus pascuorum]XP_060824018.1 uncharacterized protein LOC132911421 [Bombus pascuorum]XP_060824019.1 uncharacterized protein LOC132911422 [Bombus pascuorum]XP_060824021.1 uncharacterized protein LOC132911425 [Bombus pascuorum]XP_060824022.1 uncharacterized protein LOC132911426 [Bombus pascuorum]XP_060824023.1 uncharacterized protein LOC132911427 [Bombus pascuorum]XP_060824024.1 unc
MYLMFTYSRVAAGRRCGARQIADPVRRTSEKLVGSYLSRPLTSPSRGAPRHPASVPTGVGCERVSGTKTRRHQHTIKHTLDDEDNDDTSENINNEVYGAGAGYPSTGADVGGQAGPAVSLACDRGRMGVDHQAPIHVITTGEEEEGDIEMEEAPIEIQTL